MKSGGPWPRTVSCASRTSSALPTAAPSGWSMSVSRHVTSSRRRSLADRDHRLGERSGLVDRLHEGAPSPTLTSSTIACGAAGQLLRHDRRRDQRRLVDGRGHVAESVQQLVGRYEVGCLPDDRHADVAYLSDELVERQLRAEAGDRLELVERAAGVAEPATAHLPERHSARGDDRADRERCLVADAAGRVLVDHLPPSAPLRSIVSPLLIIASVSTNVSGLGETAEVDGHAERGHLVVGHVAARVAEDQLGQLVGRQLVPVALALDAARPDGSLRRRRTRWTCAWHAKRQLVRR